MCLWHSITAKQQGDSLAAIMILILIYPLIKIPTLAFIISALKYASDGREIRPDQ